MAEKAGYKHFMQKEIFEQPQAIIDTFRGRVSPEKGEVLLPEIGLTAEELKDIDQIHIIACGTSWHAALVGKFLSGGILPHPHDCGLCLGIPLPESHRQSQNPADSDFPIRRNGRHPGRLSGRQKEKGPDPGHL